MTAALVIEAVAIALLGLLVAGLLRSHAEILRALHQLGADLDGSDHSRGPVDLEFSRPVDAGPADGSRRTATDVAGVTPYDEAVVLAVAGIEDNTLLAFLTSGCLTCAGFWHAFRDDDLSLPAGSRVVVVTKGADAESESAIRGLAPAGHLVVMSTAAWDDYGVPGSPYFVYVEGATGRVLGEGTASSWAQVSTLLAQAEDDAAIAGARRRRHRDADRHEQAARGDAFREARADRELLAAGIHPEHPSLYASPQGEERPERD